MVFVGADVEDALVTVQIQSRFNPKIGLFVFHSLLRRILFRGKFT